MVAPGATAFRRMPAPAQAATGALRRTQRASASLDPAYAGVPPASVASLHASFSSPARQAATSGPSTPGLMAAEFDDTATAAGCLPAASKRRSPSSTDTAPK